MIIRALLPNSRLMVKSSLLLTTLCVSSVSYLAPAAAMSTSTTNNYVKVIDSHLHVWANEQEAASRFPYEAGQEPPPSLQSRASTTELLKNMDTGGVDGALIVQPINHKYDHSYVIQAINDHPDRFKGMLLHDPSLSEEEGVSRLEDLALKGFVGVRFNPYLWPAIDSDKKQWTPMSAPGGSGLAVFRRCAELRMPVGIMCFQGLQHHFDDILELIKQSPQTVVVLDHFGFTSFTAEGDSAFARLLELGKKHENVFVKISAVFRLKDETPDFARARDERFGPLLETFGPDRLMFGTDFPFVLEQPQSYGGMVELVSSWIPKKDDENLHDQYLAAVMGGTAERIFGGWGGGDSTTGTTTKSEL